jgi:hypothetical protein
MSDEEGRSPNGLEPNEAPSQLSRWKTDNITYSVDYGSERFGRGDNDHCVICQEKWDDVPEEEDTVDRDTVDGCILV